MNNLFPLTENWSMGIGIDFASAAVLVCLLVAEITEISQNKKEERHFLHLILSACLASLGDLVNCVCYVVGASDRFVLFATTLSGMLFLVELFFFNVYMLSVLRKKAFIAQNVDYMIAFVIGLLFLLFPIGMFQEPNWFYLDLEESTYGYTTAFYAYLLIEALVIVFDFFLVLSCRTVLTKREVMSWLWPTVLPILVACFMNYLPPSVFTFNVTISVLILYATVHVNRMRQIAESRRELGESNTKLMVSQIQPHFLYNALNTIYYLIEKDPEEAQEAVSTFSDYLRQNVNSLKTNETIPVKEELDHVEAYLYLERLRFGDKIRFRYDIQETGFRVPPLSIQPLVENAVKHGLSRKSEGGTVTIATLRDGDDYIVQVMDDGLGFEAGKFRDDNSAHIGIFNVHSRIQNLCNGTLSVNSKPEKGTVCVIRIPKEGNAIG